MGLAINTPKGQKTLQQEQRAYELYKSKYENIKIIETDKTGSAKVDAFLVEDGQIVGIVETKTRNMTDAELNKYGSWMLPQKKVRAAVEMSRSLEVPFYGFLYLVPEDKLLVWKVTDHDGDYLFEIETGKKWTPKNINTHKRGKYEFAFLPITEIRDIIIPA